MQPSEVAEVLDRPLSRELLDRDLCRLAYVAPDGTPRVIPIGFAWTGEHVVVATLPGAAKVRALQQNPRVALTIDTQGQWPPRALLIRGTARTETVDGVPDIYVEANRKLVPVKDFADWEQGVRALYQRMVVITQPLAARESASVCWLSAVCCRPPAWMVSRRRTTTEAVSA